MALLEHGGKEVAVFVDAHLAVRERVGRGRVHRHPSVEGSQADQKAVVLLELSVDIRIQLPFQPSHRILLLPQPLISTVGIHPGFFDVGDPSEFAKNRAQPH